MDPNNQLDIEQILNPAEDNANPAVDLENNNNDDELAEFEQGILKDEAKLSLLKEEFSQVENKLHDEYEALLETNPKALFTDEELEELASSSNVAAKNRKLRDRFEKYKEEKLTLKKEEIAKFEEILNEKKQTHELNSTEKRFIKDFPQVDMQHFAEFLQNDLTNRQLTELKDNSPTKYDFLKTAYEKYYKKTISKEGKEDDDLIPNLNDLNSASLNSDSEDIERKKYLKSIGVGRE